MRLPAIKQTIRCAEAEIKDSDSQTAGKGEEAAVITVELMET